MMAGKKNFFVDTNWYVATVTGLYFILKAFVDFQMF